MTKKLSVLLTDGEYNELIQLAKFSKRTLSAQAAWMINNNLPTLSHQQREHDSDTEQFLPIKEK